MSLEEEIAYAHQYDNVMSLVGVEPSGIMVDPVTKVFTYYDDVPYVDVGIPVPESMLEVQGVLLDEPGEDWHLRMGGLFVPNDYRMQEFVDESVDQFFRQEWFGEWFVGDGVADDAPAIQRALDQMPQRMYEAARFDPVRREDVDGTMEFTGDFSEAWSRLARFPNHLRDFFECIGEGCRYCEGFEERPMSDEESLREDAHSYSHADANDLMDDIDRAIEAEGVKYESRTERTDASRDDAPARR